MVQSESITQLALFDYDALDTETRIVVQQRTTEIKALMKRAASDIIEIGQKLIEVKRFVGGLYPCRICYADPMPPDRILVVYGLVDPRNGEVFYVGQTKQFLTRMRAHCQELPSRRSPPIERRKLIIAESGAPIYTAVLGHAANERSAEFLELLALETFKHTALNIQRNRWQYRPLYRGL